MLFFEIKQLYTFRHLIYDKDPYRIIGELDVAFIFKFWFVIVLFLCVGIFKRLTTIINYIFSVVIFSSAITFEYHVFYAYVGINFLLMFMPINRVLSIDALIEKLKYSVMSRQYKIDRKILKINYHKDHDISLVKIKLKEGKRHQIRVQLMALGHPILGDKLYGEEHPLRMFLHCFEYQLEYEGKTLTFRDKNFYLFFFNFYMLFNFFLFR